MGGIIVTTLQLARNFTETVQLLAHDFIEIVFQLYSGQSNSWTFNWPYLLKNHKIYLAQLLNYIAVRI